MPPRTRAGTQQDTTLLALDRTAEWMRHNVLQMASPNASYVDFVRRVVRELVAMQQLAAHEVSNLPGVDPEENPAYVRWAALDGELEDFMNVYRPNWIRAANWTDRDIQQPFLQDARRLLEILHLERAVPGDSRTVRRRR
jgi:hypothetical protein